jgi:hypothetical protein
MFNVPVMMKTLAVTLKLFVVKVPTPNWNHESGMYRSSARVTVAPSSILNPYIPFPTVVRVQTVGLITEKYKLT